MPNRKLTKFPVITEDGTEYRVTIKERKDHGGFPFVRVKFYIQRKHLGFKKIASYDMRDGWTYLRNSPNYIAIARQVFAEFQRNELAPAKRKSAAIDAFQAWDGRL